MKHLKSKISRTLVLYIILFSSVITLVLTLIQLRIDYNYGINVIEQRLDQIKLTNMEAITQSLWTLDSDSIALQLDGLKRIPDIIKVELYDANNQKLFNLGEIDTEHVINRDYLIIKNYKKNDINLGTLKVIATKENLYQQLIDTVIVILISQAVKTFLVSIFILVVFYYLVTRHIGYIADYAGNLNLKHQPRPIRLNRATTKHHKHDELDQLVNALNLMSINNYKNYSELETNKNKLAESEARLSAIFDAMTDTVVLADTDRRIIMTNKAMYKMFGYRNDEMTGKLTKILYADPEEFERQGQVRYQTNHDIKTSTYEINYRRKDGSTFPSETMGGHVKLVDGTHIGYIGIIRDISNRKKTEESNLKLQKELTQTQKMESIGHLTGGIAHDFNNILATILGYVDLAISQTEDIKDENLTRYLKHIKSGGERASNLVKQMLEFSKSTPSTPENIYVTELINETLTILTPTLPANIKLSTSLHTSTPRILIDKIQLQQVILNLCVNAIDAMEESGTLTIGVAYSRNVEETCQSCHTVLQGDFVEIRISDTGSGIEPEVYDFIFEPFFTTKEVGKGTGMGLSVVHGILHKHNAHILLESQKHLGSTFRLLFTPVLESDEVDQSTVNE